jgi:hypothetical protein
VVGGDGPWLASPRSPPFVTSVGFLQALIKRRLEVTLSLPAWAVSGEVLGRLLAQPALHAEPASLAGCRSDPWDASQQVALSLAYLGGHPHDKEAMVL